MKTLKHLTGQLSDAIWFAVKNKTLLEEDLKKSIERTVDKACKQMAKEIMLEKRTCDCGYDGRDMCTCADYNEFKNQLQQNINQFLNATTQNCTNRWG